MKATTMKATMIKSLVIAALAILLAGCGGNDDPVVNAISDSTADIELDDFYVSRADIYPGETVVIEWRARDALIFEVKLYLSKDRVISSNDRVIVDEECGIESNDHCSSNEDVEFFCRYRSDNSFDCGEDGDLMQRNDLTEFFDQLPQSTYLILEVCSDGECDRRNSDLTFY